MPMQTIAIIVGITHHSQGAFGALPAAEMDAVNFARAAKYWGIPEENIFLFLNDEATAKSIEQLFEDLAKKQERFKFIFYFCGHGYRTSLKAPKSYLIFHDSKLKSDGSIDSFCLDSLALKIAKLNAQESYVFIDACHLRVNTFVNPNLEEEVKGGRNADKSLFCLFSSGIEKSFESVEGRYGYFTKALLNGLSQIQELQGSPLKLLHHIQGEMSAEGVPLPEMVNFGNQHISFTAKRKLVSQESEKTCFGKFLFDVQDALIQNPDRLLLLCGEEGSGKTTICKQIASKKFKTLYFEIPREEDALFDPINFLNQKIYQEVGCSLDELERDYPFYLIILDQLERLNQEQTYLLFKTLDALNHLRFLCAGRQVITGVGTSCLNFFVPHLSPDEAVSLIKRLKPDFSDDEAYLACLVSKGNPGKIEKIAFASGCLEGLEINEFKKAVAAVYSCCAYYEKKLFEEVFHLKQGVLDFFEKMKLVVPFKEGFVPDTFLNAFAEYLGLTVDSQAILNYWCQQAKSLPSDPEVAKSLILAVKCFGYQQQYEKVLKRAFQSLAVDEENLSYFVDGADIFLSLPYRTGTALYLGKVLKILGEDQLSKKLLNKFESKTALVAALTALMVFISFFYFVFSSEPSLNHHMSNVKQTHPDFVGRENYMELLETKLIKEAVPNTVSTVILWGEGGVGKSEIAIAFANGYLKEFDLIHWIDADTEEGYSASYQNLASQLQIPVIQQEPIEKLVRKVHDYLETTHELKWLLIYDNAGHQFNLPERGTGAIIVTTRDHTQWNLYSHYEVTYFDEDEALSLMRKVTLKQKNPYQTLLIKELEGYPLSLNLAAHYIAETPNMTEESYLELLLLNKGGVFDMMPVDGRYPLSLINSWNMTANHLHEIQPDVLKWLHFCSFLYPDIIPLSWLEDWLTLFSEDELDAYSLKMKINEILRSIVNQSLVRYDNKRKNLSLHRFKQEIFKYDEHFDPKTKEDVLHFLVDQLEKFERYDEMERHPEVWAKLREWEVHAVWFLSHYNDSSSRDELALLYNLLGCWKMLKGEYGLADVYYSEALKIRLELFGGKDLRTIITMSNKAWGLWKLNRAEEAKAIYLEAIALFKSSHEEEDPYIAFLMNNFSLVLKGLNEFESMKTVNEKVLNLRLKLYGKGHVYTADSMHNLATAYWKLGDYDQAIDYFEQALDCYRSCYGEEHPYFAITLHSIGRTFLSKEDFVSAEVNLSTARKKYVKLYGDKHPYTIMCTQNIGQLFEKMGREREAFEMFKTALSHSRELYDRTHPSVVSLLEDLHELSRKSQDSKVFMEVKKLLEEA